jgi:hypothetical protein
MSLMAQNIGKSSGIQLKKTLIYLFPMVQELQFF